MFNSNQNSPLKSQFSFEILRIVSWHSCDYYSLFAYIAYFMQQKCESRHYDEIHARDLFTFHISHFSNLLKIFYSNLFVMEDFVSILFEISEIFVLLLLFINWYLHLCNKIIFWTLKTTLLIFSLHYNVLHIKHIVFVIRL